MSPDSSSRSNEAPCHVQPASEPERKLVGSPLSPESGPSNSTDERLLEILNRLVAALETQNARISELITLIVSVEAVEPEADPDAPPTHDLSGKPIRTR
jgi:hypothetical protein